MKPYHMFSIIKIEEYVKSVVCGIFRVNVVAKNEVLVSFVAHFNEG